MTTDTGLLLAVDEVELYPPGQTDPHGWRLVDLEHPYWSGTGNLQLAPGGSDPHAGDGGGHGPHEPAHVVTGTLFLPPGVQVTEGSLAVIRKQAFALSQVRLVPDPADPGGGIACLTATATTIGAGDDAQLG